DETASRVGRGTLPGSALLERPERRRSFRDAGSAAALRKRAARGLRERAVIQTITDQDGLLETDRRAPVRRSMIASMPAQLNATMSSVTSSTEGCDCCCSNSTSY